MVELVEEVFQGEGCGAEFALHFAGFVFVDGLLGFFDEGDDVTHAEDAASESIRVEGLDAVGPLADADVEDGEAGDGDDGEGGAAAGVSVHLGEDEAGEGDLFVELLGDLDGVLAGHGVDDEEDFDGVEGFSNVGELLHELFVDLESTAGVHEEPVGVLFFGFFEGVAGEGDGVFGSVFAVDGDVYLGAEGGELLDGGGASEVSGGHDDALALLFEEAGEFGAGGGLSGALEADEEDGCGPVAFAVQVLTVGAEEGGEFFMDDLDDLLGGGDGLEDFRADGAFSDAGLEVPDDAEVDVGFQEGAPDLFEGVVDIVGGDAAFAGEASEDAGESVG